MIQTIQFAGDFSRHYFIMSSYGLTSSFPAYRNFSKGASKFCVSIFSTRLLHRPWPLLDIQGPNVSFGTTRQVVNWRLQRFNVEMFEICIFHSTVISIHMLIQTRLILVQNSNVPGVTCVIIVEKCCWTKSSRNLFNNIYTLTLLIRWPINRSNRFSDFLRLDRLDQFGKIIKSIFSKFWKRKFQFFLDFQNFFGFLKFRDFVFFVYNPNFPYTLQVSL